MQAIHSFRSLFFAGVFIGLFILAQPVAASHLDHILLWRTDYSTRWLNEPLQTYSANWNATHMDMVNIGDSANTSVLIAMKRKNPNIKVLFYGLDFNMFASDNGIKSWLTSNGYNVEDAFLHFSEDTTLQFKKSDGTIQQVTIPGCSLATRSEACRVRYFAWTDTRWLFNPKDTGLRAYQGRQLSDSLMKTYDDPATPEIENYTYDGVMLDEHSPGLTFMGGWSATSIISGGTILEYGMRADASSLDSIYNKDVAGLLAAEKASVGPNKFIIPNIADYLDPLAAERADAAKGDFKEFMLSKVTPDRSASLMIWDYVYGRTANQVSTILSTFSTPESNPQISTYNSGNYYSSMDRARMMILANYYMAKDAGNQFVYLEMWGNLNRLVSDGKTEMIYPKAVDVNVGSPLGNYVQVKSGNGPVQCSGVTKTYRVYRREFSNAFVFFRPQDEWDCTTYDDTTAVSLTLPQALYLLHEDGTLGPPMTTLNLRNAEAVILIKDPNFAGGSTGNKLPAVSLTSPSNNSTFASPANISISVNASDSDGTIAKVEFFQGTTKLGEDTTSPYGFTWSNVTAGNYELIARAIDNAGDIATSLPVSITVNSNQSQTPFAGTAMAIPGTIQAEDFDNGGEGVAYHDLEVSNQGGQYRLTEGVDIETTEDIGGGYNVGWMKAGEWLEYTVNINTTGTYRIETHVSSNGNGGTFHIEFDGVDKTGPLTILDTGGWQNWQTLTKTGVFLNAGQQMMRVALDSDGPNGNVGNLNYVTLNLTISTDNTPPAVPKGLTVK